MPVETLAEPVVDRSTAAPTEVTLTPAAVAKIREMVVADGLVDKLLRVYVEGGGCSGLQYGFAFDDLRDGDQVFETQGLRIAMDPLSAPYLTGCEIGYIDALTGAGFKVNNPNAKSTCGCGSSFS